MTEPKPTRLQQLKSALDAGLIDQDTFDAATVALSAHLSGDGAIAQGPGAAAAGAGGVVVQQDNKGVINLGLLIQQGSRSGASQKELTQAYLARILTQANQLPLVAGESGKTRVQLSSVYTALLTQRSEADPAVSRGIADLRRSTEHPDKKLSALEVLNAERKLVLLGGPGSGKSTFVNFVALSMAGELLGVPSPNLRALTAPLSKEADDDEDPKPQRWERGPLLPVPVVLRELASQLPAPGNTANAETVWRYLCGRLKQAALEDFAPILKQCMLDPGALVLFDGLDEVPDAHDRRVQIKQAVQDFATTFSNCRFLVTSRTYAYQRQDWKLDNFAEVHLQPFSLGQIRGFVDAWYGHMVELLRLTEADARDRADLLNRTVARNERIRELAERPLLLTLIAQLQTEGGGPLPEKREELYDKAVDMLLTKWESMKVRAREDGTKEIEPSLAEWLNAGRDDIRKQLNQLAFEAHRDQPQLTGTADIRQETLIAGLLRASAHRNDLNVGLLEKYLRDRAGILAAHGVGIYQFPHRSFQEYLAACHLTDDDYPDKLAELARTDPNRWREVALLAAAKAARGSKLSAWALAETLCISPPPDEPGADADYWGGLLAGRVLVECADLAKVAPRNAEKLARVRCWQHTIMRHKTLPATERSLSGRSLAVLGDPRPEVTSLDDMQFCLVPPRPFVMGDRDEQHTVELTNPFFVGHYPVTVAQWREYVHLGDIAVDDERSLRGRENDPVIYVTWHDARRLCQFLTQRWKEILPHDFVVTLPSEAEWEKAARGGEQIPVDPVAVTLEALGESLESIPRWAQRRNPYPARDYPWGDAFDADNANVESTIGETSAVGCYAAGRSPYGCEEMSGNVWEWTRSLWGTEVMKPDFGYPYDPADSKRENLDAGEDVWRVVRGGSWINFGHFARCAVRYGFLPGFRGYLQGFRVVLRCAPVS